MAVIDAAELDSPRQVAVGTFGEVYIADSLNNAIRKLTPAAPTVGHVTNPFGNISVVAENTWCRIRRNETGAGRRYAHVAARRLCKRTTADFP